MHLKLLSWIVLTLASTTAAAQTKNGVSLTGYAGGCGSVDSSGGGDRSSWGIGHANVKPSQHTLGGKADQNVVLVAVPQAGGTASLYGCFLEFDFTHSNVPQKIRAQFETARLFAGDHYGKGSNNKNKCDISLPCSKDRKGVNSFSFAGVKVTKTHCLGTSQVAQTQGLPNENRIQTASISSDSNK